MVKNIIIVVLVIISLFTTVYAIYQQTEAKRQESLAVANAMQAQAAQAEAERAMQEAILQRNFAEAAMAEARKLQEDLAREVKLALEKCK